MMNAISAGGQILFLSVHGGGGVLTAGLSAPLVRGTDVADGGSVRFRMVEEPGESDYARTRLFRFDAQSGRFGILDATFERGETEKVAGGVGCGRFCWLPVAYDVEGNFAPGRVVSVELTDGSVGLVERVRAALVAALREDGGLQAFHAEWRETDERRCHVFQGFVQSGRSVGRAPFVEVDTKSVSRRSPFVVSAVFEVRVWATDGPDRLAECVAAAVLSSENRWLNSEHVLGVGVRSGEPERGLPLKRQTLWVDVEMATRV